MGPFRLTRQMLHPCKSKTCVISHLQVDNSDERTLKKCKKKILIKDDRCYASYVSHCGNNEGMETHSASDVMLIT